MTTSDWINLGVAIGTIALAAFSFIAIAINLKQNLASRKRQARSYALHIINDWAEDLYNPVFKYAYVYNDIEKVDLIVEMTHIARKATGLILMANRVGAEDSVNAINAVFNSVEAFVNDRSNKDKREVILKCLDLLKDAILKERIE